MLRVHSLIWEGGERQTLAKLEDWQFWSIVRKGDTVGHLFFFFFLLQGAVVLFALKTLFMKSTQLGSISNESPVFCGPSICQWLAMHRGTEWVSSRRWASLATEVKQSTSSSVSSTSQVSSASWVNFESYSSFPFLRISRLPLELKWAPLFWLSLYKSDLRAGQTNQECGSP